MTTSAAPASAPASPAAPTAGAAPAAPAQEGTQEGQQGASPAPAAPAALTDPSAAPAAPEAAKPPEGAPGERAPIAFDKTGDIGLDMALDFLGKLGFDPADPGMLAAGNGDFGILRAQLAALGDKAQGWEQFLALGEKAMTSRIAEQKAKQEADQKAIHEAVGGPENWAQVQKWASENAEPAEREAVNAALSAGGIAAKAMATYLNGLYGKATGTVVEPGEVAPGAGRQQTATTALSPVQYRQEIAALVAKVGSGRVESTPEYAALQSRRLAWRG